MKTLVVYGDPYSGKSTYIQRLTTQYAFCHVSIGDILRFHIRYQTTLGRQIQSIGEAGQLVPSELIEQAVKQQISQLPASTPVLLENYPRTIEQASILEQNLGIDIVAVVYLTVESIEADGLARSMAKKLEDDQIYQQTIDKIEAFQQRLIPVLNYYRKKNCLTSISSSSSREDTERKLEQLIKDNNIA